MDDQAKELLIGLRTLSQIPQGGKLNTSSQEVSIYMGGWVEWFRTLRLVYDGEPETRNFLKSFYNRVNQKCRNLVLLPRSPDIDNIVRSFIDAIGNSLSGLENLRNSYKSHASMKSHTGFILEDIINPLMYILHAHQALVYNPMTFKDDILSQDMTKLSFINDDDDDNNDDGGQQQRRQHRSSSSSSSSSSGTATIPLPIEITGVSEKSEFNFISNQSDHHTAAVTAPIAIPNTKSNPGAKHSISRSVSPPLSAEAKQFHPTTTNNTTATGDDVNGWPPSIN